MRIPAGHEKEPEASVRIAAGDEKDPARGLAQLVLTVVELLRELMERQAMRRVDCGELSEQQVERLGQALEALEDRMTQVCRQFGFDRDQLNLDLGPLGNLL
jgi:Gas vesicle protein K